MEPPMLSASSPSNIQISVSDHGFAYWLSRPYVGDATRAALASAAVLLAPDEGHGTAPGPLFPNQTDELLAVMADSLPQDMRIAACVDDDKYKELGLHSALVILATFVTTKILAPIVVIVASDYLKKRYSPETNPVVRFRLIATEKNGEDERAIEISYEGPLSGLAPQVTEAIDHGFTTPLKP